VLNRLKGLPCNFEGYRFLSPDSIFLRILSVFNSRYDTVWRLFCQIIGSIYFLPIKSVCLKNPNSVKLIWQYENQNNWISILKNELDNKRPIQYQGQGNGGRHSFIIDGYDNTSFFHINWGWGGQADSYYQINLLNPPKVGIGGGSGEFNFLQNAVIGIQPPATNTNTNLQMYSLFNATYNNQVLTITTNFTNAGSSAFQGDFAVALFDDQNEFYDFVEIKNGYSLPSNNRFTNNLTFSKYNLLLPVGKFKLAAYYKVTNGDWVQVSGTSTVKNPIDLQIKTVYSQDINMYSSFSVLTSNPRQSTTLSVNFDVINVNSSTFYGEFGVLAYDLQGNYKGIVSSISASNGLPYNYHYTGGLTISTSSLPLELGIYNLVAGYKKTGGLWNWVGGDGTYTSGRKIEVGEAPIYADNFENNDSEATAYNFKYTPSQDYHAFITYGSNIHVGTDKDYYKMDLPQDSSRYIIKARVHDKNNSTQGDFKCDVIFSVNQDNQWSKTYDWGLDQSYLLSKGGKLMFLVSPIYEGFKGNYLLDFNVTTIRRPSIKVNGETNLCEGEQTKLQANQGYELYKWFKDGNKIDKITSEISVLEGGKYTVIGIKGGVESVISENVQISVKALPIKPTILKEDKPDKFVLTSSSNVNNQWYLGNTLIKGATEAIFIPEQVGKYFVRVSDGRCVNNSEIIEVKIDKPEIQKVGNNPLCEGELLILKAPLGFGTYRWFNNKDSLSTNTSDLTISKSGKYLLWVGRGKIISPISDTVQVVVNPLPPKPIISLFDSLGVNYLKSSSYASNQWFSNGSLINGATEPLFKNTGFGNYSVKVTLLGCSSISDLFVITGTEDNFEQLVNLYPNPTNGFITIDLPFYREVNFTVYNFIGNEVYRDTVKQNRQTSKVLNLTSFSPGAYILKIAADGKVVNRKIIIL
jgi:Peptidase C10 family/Secretion system C-terminal sorting domain